jgi:shikimate kinase
MSGKTNFSLIGFMGSGKTSSGQELARLLKFDFLDLDQLIQNEAGLSVFEIFKEYGEAGFREREKAQIARIQTLRKTVLATGGGSWLDPAIRKSLTENSWTIWLKVSVDQSWRRVSPHLSQRPLLSQSADPFLEIMNKMSARSETYAMADYHVETDHQTPREVAAEILKIITRDQLIDRA